MALADACSFSLSAHVPIQAVRARIQKNLQREVKTNLQFLRRKGYCQIQPTRGGQTWLLTRFGLEVARSLLGQG